MASLPIRWILARTYCQATEKEDRVQQALDTAVPGGAGSRDRFEGQFRNPVIVFTKRLDRAEELRRAWAVWRDAGLLQPVAQELERRLDEEGVLHVRVDKQAAFEGTLVPASGADSIDIQVKLKAYPAKPEEILRVARSILEEAA